MDEDSEVRSGTSTPQNPVPLGAQDGEAADGSEAATPTAAVAEAAADAEDSDVAAQAPLALAAAHGSTPSVSQPSSQDLSAASSVANVVSRMTVQALRHMRLKSANSSATAVSEQPSAASGDADNKQASDGRTGSAATATPTSGGSEDDDDDDDDDVIGNEGDREVSAGASSSTMSVAGGNDTRASNSAASRLSAAEDEGLERRASMDAAMKLIADLAEKAQAQRDGGGDGDDDYDDDDGGDDGGGEGGNDFALDDADEDDEDVDDMMLLEPDHPLMQQFQTQVTVQLTAQKEQLELKRAEKATLLKEKEKERDDIGVSLYNLQQQLAKQQSQLEQHQEQQSEIIQQRKQCEVALQKARRKYQDCLTNVRLQHKRAEEIRSKLDKATLELRQLEAAAEKMKSEMEISKRTAKKVDDDVLEAEEAKLQQDAYVTTLINQLDRLTEQVALYQMQMQAQIFETQESRGALNDAVHELEVINIEKKDLLKQWNDSLLAMKHRDEALSALQTAMRHEDERMVAVNSELNGFGRSIAKEQERNEALISQRTRLTNELSMVQSQLHLCREKQKRLQMDYQAYTRSLHQTEQQLQKAQTDRKLRLQEIDGVRQQTEREVAERLHLEDAILEKTMAMLTLDKAAQHSRKVLGKLRTEEKKRVQSIIETQGDIERTKLDIDNTQAEKEYQLEALAGLGKQLDERNKLITHSEAEIKKRNVIIERKQNRIDQLNKKINQILTERGGEEDVGPLELTIKTLQKQIEDSQEECRQQQQFWLRKEQELVRRVKTAHQQTAAIEHQKRKLIILEQKKLRQEASITREKKELSSVSNEIHQMQLDMVRLNYIISQKRGQEQNLVQDNVLLESEFVGELKDAERQSIESKMEIGANEEAKERLKNSLIESEQQIMLWEKKIQIVKETKETLGSDEMEGEIRHMRTELHTMQTKHDEIKRKQQNLIRMMENSVKQRATIDFKAEVKATTGTAEKTKGHLRKQMEGLARKVQQSRRNSATCDYEIVQLHKSQKEMSGYIQEKQASCEAMTELLVKLHQDAVAEQGEKEKLALEVRWNQQRQKQFANAAAGRYAPFVKKREEGPSLDDEMKRHQMQTQSLLAVSDELVQSFPQYANTIGDKLLAPLRLRLRSFAA